MEKRLHRNEQDKMIAGVCAGLAEYFDVDVTWIRIAFVIAVIAGASGILAYVILWIAVPARPFIPGTFNQPSGRYNAGYNPESGRYNADYRVYEDKKEPTAYSAYSVPEPPVMVKPKGSNNGRMIAGLLLICFGAFFMLDEFDVIPYWFDFDKLWPLVFIIPGILIISRSGKKNALKEEMKTEEFTAAPANETGEATTTEEPKI